MTTNNAADACETASCLLMTAARACRDSEKENALEAILEASEAIETAKEEL